MSTNAVDLLIKSRPMWHQVEPQQVPVSVKQIYGVLGRRGHKWESILSTTDDIHIARRTMEAANSAGIFERIVITQGNSVNGAPAAQWQTVECALPQHRVVTGDSFATLLTKLQTQTANINPEGLYQHNPAPIVAEKHPVTWSLFIAFALSALNMNAPALVFVAALCCLEILFLSSKTPIRTERMKSIDLTRIWFYAILNGALFAPLVVSFFH